MGGGSQRLGDVGRISVPAVADTVTELGFVLAGGLFGGAKDTLDRCMTKLHDVMWCC